MYLYTVTGAVGEEGYLDLAKSGDLTGKKCLCQHDKQMPVQLCVLSAPDETAAGGKYTVVKRGRAIR